MIMNSDVTPDFKAFLAAISLTSGESLIGPSGIQTAGKRERKRTGLPWGVGYIHVSSSVVAMRSALGARKSEAGSFGTGMAKDKNSGRELYLDTGFLLGHERNIWIRITG